MKADGDLKLVSQLLDLPICDCDGKYCGIVDDVELSGGPGKPLNLKALLVGPGAYAGRMPVWATWLIDKLVGAHITRVPIAEVSTIGSTVKLRRSCSELGLDTSERRAERWLSHGGAL